MRGPVSDSLFLVPTPDTDRSEELSVAYVTTIAAQAGIRAEFGSRKDYGTDVTFKRLRRRKSDNHYTEVAGVNVPCQIKSVRFPEWKIIKYKGQDVVSYNLKAKNYNDLVTSSEGFLILMCLPANINDWVKQDVECLRLYKCSYYWEPGPNDIETSNKKTQVIHIPLDQLFTADVLIQIVDREQLEGVR